MKVVGDVFQLVAFQTRPQSLDGEGEIKQSTHHIIGGSKNVYELVVVQARARSSNDESKMMHNTCIWRFHQLLFVEAVMSEGNGQGYNTFRQN